MSVAVVRIGGIARSVAPNTLECSDALNQPGAASFTLHDLEGDYLPPIGSPVEIEDSGTVIWRGLVEDSGIIKPVPEGSPYRRTPTRCSDHTKILQRRTAGFREWTNTRAYDIARDIVTEFLDGEGIGTTYLTAGGGPLLEKFQTKLQYCSDALTALCDASSLFYSIDASKQLRLYATGVGTAAWTLQPGGNLKAIQNTLTQTKSDVDYANRVWVKASSFLREGATQSFTGDGSETYFELDSPAGAIASVQVAGVEKLVTIKGENVGDVYWTPGSASLEFAVAPASGAAISVTYTEIIESQKVADDLVAMGERAATEGGTGVYERIIEVSQQIDGATAQTLANRALAAYKQSSWVTTLQSDNIKPTPGQLIAISGWTGYETGNYLVRRVRCFDRGDGALRREIECVKGRLIQDAVAWFRSLASGGQIGAVPVGDAGGDPVDVIPDIPGSCSAPVVTSIENIDTQYALNVSCTAPSPLGDTRKYRWSVRFFNDVAGTLADSDIIAIGITSARTGAVGPQGKPTKPQWIRLYVEALNEWDQAGPRVQSAALYALPYIQTGTGVVVDPDTGMIEASERRPENTDFEVFNADGTAKGYAVGPGSGIGTFGAYSGTMCARVTTAGGYVTQGDFACVPGLGYEFEVWCRNNSHTGSVICGFSFFDNSGAYISAGDPVSGTAQGLKGISGSGWQLVRCRAVAPAGAVGFAVYPLFVVTGGSGNVVADKWTLKPLEDVAVSAFDRSGTQMQLKDGAVTLLKFGANLVPFTATSTLPATTYLGTVNVIFNNEPYRWNGTSYVKVLNAADTKTVLAASPLDVAHLTPSLKIPREFTYIPAAYTGDDYIVYRSGTARELRKWNGSVYGREVNSAVMKSEFAVDKLTAAELAAGSVGTNQLAVTTSILLGAGGGKCPIFVCVDSGGFEVASIGDRTSLGDSTFKGIYAQRIRVAPTYGSSQRLEATSSGVSIENIPLQMATATRRIRIDASNGLRTELISNPLDNAAYNHDGILIQKGGGNLASYGTSGWFLRKYLDTNTSVIGGLDDGSGGWQNLAAYLQIQHSSASSYGGWRIASGPSADTIANSRPSAALSLTGANSFVDSQSFRIGGVTVIDANKNLRLHNYVQTTESVPSTFPRWLPAYDAFGFYLGKIPIYT